jgi:hypothetical protein
MWIKKLKDGKGFQRIIRNNYCAHSVYIMWVSEQFASSELAGKGSFGG